MTHSNFKSTNHFSCLDGIRCFAIIAVLWHHSDGADPFNSPILARGYLGVDLFFVLSGFLITTILIREKIDSGTISLKKFYIRRSLRIFPLYYGYLAAVLLLYLLKNTDQLSEYLKLLPVFAFYLTNWMPGSIEHDFERLWSLAVEEQFYLVWPLLLLTLGIRFGKYFALSFLTAVTIMAMLDLGPFMHELTRHLVPFRTIFFGSVLAILLNKRESYDLLAKYCGNKYSVVFFGVAILVAIQFTTGPLSSSVELLVHLLMFALIGSVVINEENILKRLLTYPLIKKFGLVSYGIYVLHGQFWTTTGSIVQSIPYEQISDSRITFFLVFSMISFIAALCSFYIFEIKFLNLKSKLAP